MWKRAQAERSDMRLAGRECDAAVDRAFEFSHIRKTNLSDNLNTKTPAESKHVVFDAPVIRQSRLQRRPPDVSLHPYERWLVRG